MVAACLEDGLAVSYNIKYILIYDSAVAFLNTYPNKLKAYSQPTAYTFMFILFSYSSVSKFGSNQGVLQWMYE